MENKIRQLRKGALELAILGILYRESHYGYSLIRTLTGTGDLELTEGTIYPILSRLAKEGLVRAQWVDSRQGPPRKYYTLTAKGRGAFEVLHEEFRKLADIIDQVGHGPAHGDGPRRRAHAPVSRPEPASDDLSPAETARRGTRCHETRRPSSHEPRE